MCTQTAQPFRHTVDLNEDYLTIYIICNYLFFYIYNMYMCYNPNCDKHFQGQLTKLTTDRQILNLKAIYSY